MSDEKQYLNNGKNYDSDSGEYADNGDLQSCKPISGSYFDLTFKPTSKVTYKTILPQVLACVSAASFHLPIGLVVAYSAILLDQLENKPDPSIIMDENIASWIASATVLVVPVAALLTGFLVDGIGRVNTLKSAAIPYILGWTLIAQAPNVTVIIIGRVLTGFALAMGSSPAAVYITEVARPDLRGALICLGPSMTSFGMVLVYLAGCFLHWRTVAWINIGFAVLPLMLMYLFTPESPTWLVSRGRNEEALKACKIVSVDKAKDLIHQRRVKLLEREHERNSIIPHVNVFYKFFTSISQPTVYKPFAILTMCFFFQQMSGIYVLIFYAVRFFKDVSQDVNPYLLSVVVGLIRMFVGFITSQLLYKFGRRVLILTSVLSMAVLIFMSGGISLLVKKQLLDSEWLIVPIICLLFYICMSTMGLLSIPWTMTAEMYPLEVRGVMQGATVCIAHVLMFGVIKSFYFLSAILGGTSGIQLFFAGVCIAGFIFMFIFLPETHKRTLEEISDYFRNNITYIGRRKSIYDDRFPVQSEDCDNQKV